MKKKIKQYLKYVKSFATNKKDPSQAGPLPPEYNIQEVLPIHCRESGLNAPRMNLLIPALSIRYSFGGINTAIDFFSTLIKNAKDARIIITDEAVSDLKGFSQANEWQLLQSTDEDVDGRVIICFGDRYNKTIPVRQSDIFVATAWWTSYNAERILIWQKEKWGVKPPPLIFLIQDFEPGFYKWSSRYLLALSTYAQKNMIAVINTSLLYDFFVANEISFNQHYVFEPQLNTKLVKYLSNKASHTKKKKIIFYGRPSVERNAFETIVKGLEIWSFRHAHAADWQIISLGETYPNIKFGNGMEVQVAGKVSIDEYANILLDACVGISLMISPHPSYPPLEMAAFDLAVITNKFSNKNLSKIHDNIFSLDSINPENIAQMVCDLCTRFESNENVFANHQFRHTDFLDNHKPVFYFMDSIRKHYPNLIFN